MNKETVKNPKASYIFILIAFNAMEKRAHSSAGKKKDPANTLGTRRTGSSKDDASGRVGGPRAPTRAHASAK